jgi:beta-phosphoglucomutase-like phosphatase (HAD superfamily)
MDGVVTQTAVVHAAAWKRLFDDYLSDRAARTGTAFLPFGAKAECRRHTDSVPRYEGVRRFLASRGITLPEGIPSDPPSAETVCGLGNRKNACFLERIAQDSVRPFATTVDVITSVRERGLRTDVISASENATEVLASADVLELFDVKVDGTDAAASACRTSPNRRSSSRLRGAWASRLGARWSSRTRSRASKRGGAGDSGSSLAWTGRVRRRARGAGRRHRGRRPRRAAGRLGPAS